MDDDHELIDALCTRIGIMMEDGSVIALSSRRDEGQARVVDLAEAIGQMSALIAAARAVGYYDDFAPELCRFKG